MRKFIVLLGVLALFAAACSSGDDISVLDTASDDTDEPASNDDQPQVDDPQQDEGEEEPVGSTGDSNDICALGAELEADDPFEEISIFDGEAFFDTAGKLWDQVAAAAPGELQNDVATVSAGLDDLQEVLEAYDYDFFNEDLAAAMDGIDTTAMDAAGGSIEQYLSDICGIELNTGGSSADTAPPGFDPAELDDVVEDLENIDPDDAAAILSQVFGIDQELAECLNDELGGIDAENLDPAVMTQEVCGTTLLEVISGIGG